VNRFFLLVCFIVFSAISGFAENRQFNLTLTPGVSFFGSTDHIENVTLSFWGENSQDALTLGGVNGIFDESSGVALGLVNYADTYRGATVGAVNTANGTVTGLQLGGYNQVADDLAGCQLGAINVLGSELRGLQLGLVSRSESADAAAQVSVVNSTGTLTGLQLGVLNRAQSSRHSAQIGAINFVLGHPVETPGPGELPTTPEECSGLQLGVVNYCRGFLGTQVSLLNVVQGSIEGGCFGAINLVAGHVKGTQIGVFNRAGNLNGSQWGVINAVDAVEKGLQVGLINLMPRDYGSSPVTVLVNWSF
jgi:hypothetical protein